MKKITLKQFRTVITLALFFAGSIGYAQNIQISIINAQNTNDGTNDFYEADITIQTIEGQADFKLGSGQLYFNYNTAAFGENVSANSSFEVTANYGSGYFLGEMSGFTSFYDISTINDNTTSRVSWAFSQGVSSGAMTEIVGSVPKLMVRIKIQYVNVAEFPMVVFETDENLVSGSRDQFYTGCGPFDSASTTLDCTGNVDPQNINTQFLDAVLDSNGSTLSDNEVEELIGFSIYPNPSSEFINIKSINAIDSVELFNLLGKTVLKTKNTSQIKVNHLPTGMYLIKVHALNGTWTKKIIIE